MACDVDEILAANPCFSTLNPHLIAVVTAQLLCDVAEGIANIVSDNPALQSVDDNEWYRINGMEITPGNAVAMVNQSPTDPGPEPFLIIENLTDGLFYEVRMVGTAPLAQLEIDPTPTVDPEIPAIITVGADQYELKIVNDPFPTITLVIIP